ncbi:subtilase family protein [Chitinophaga niastensis]|uniref:Subtilase family protein n=1 Tax=Chitinophaga niastensis TaxID=536980 RepID=A0A2P8HHA3_CHINA|nr:S8/S53 family peptidase [Chitinophaga niastensis]PSL45614.1 subtilase family protein [Chitinophaga niastensis]
MKNLNLLIAFALVITIVSCQKRESTLNATFPGNENPTSVVPKEKINAFIRAQWEKNHQFDWKTASDSLLWSALVQSDSVLSVGYQPAGFSDLANKIHAIDVTDANWKSTRAQVLDLILKFERKTSTALSEKDVLVFKENKLPVFDIKVSQFATIKALRASNLVRYAEPIGYGKYMDDGSSTKYTARAGASASSVLSFGCGTNVATPGLVAGVDYTNITPGAKQSWNYTYHNIPQAWARSTGQNVKVMIIDTGVSPDQDNLGASFNQGSSTGRTIEKLVTFPGATPDDLCGHGTAMSGALAGPRGTNGASTGIAYNCNLVVVHAAENVVILSSESVQGVSAAYILGGDRTDVKIISMSMGTIIAFNQITDAIQYAYNKGKLMFCAAGTTNSSIPNIIGVIFPAYLPTVVAVTGMKDNLTDRCVDCHVGPEVAFTIVMEKTSNGTTALSLAMSGAAPSTVGGSSVATSSCSAIAALVWSKYPTYPKDSIIARMKRASSFASNRNHDFGWGIPNADVAVGQ